MTADISFESPIHSLDYQKKFSLEREGSISQNLFCAKCKSYFKNPKILPCLHFFCEECIHNFMVKNDEITCHLCQEKTPGTVKISDLMSHYPMSDLIHLKQLREKVKRSPKEIYCQNCSFGDARPKAPGAYYCCDCKEIMCLHDRVAHNKYKPNHRSVTIDEFREEDEIANLLSDISSINCKKHKRQEIKYYCIECEQEICDDCGFEDHNTHKKTFLKAALNLFSDSVDKKMEELAKPGIEMLEEVKHTDENIQMMGVRQRETIDKITKHFNDLIKGMEQRRDTLIGNVNVWYSNVRSQVFSASRKQNDLLEKIGTLADFVSSYRDFPNVYKVELTSIITKRFNRLSMFVPKVPLKIKTIDYMKGVDSDFDVKIDNIGCLNYMEKTCFDTPIKQINRGELVPKTAKHLEEKASELKTYDIQGVAQGYQNNLYVFTSECADKEASNRYTNDSYQILDANCNITHTVSWNSILKNPTQILIGRESQVYVLESEQKRIIIRDESFNRTIRAITSDDSNNISDLSCIALTSTFDLVVHNRQTSELFLFDHEEFTIRRRLPLKASVIKRKESPVSIARIDSKVRSGDRERKQQKLNVPDKERQTPIIREPGSITIAVNSKDYVYVASEDRALITIYNLEGKEMGEINFQERLKRLEESSIERKSSVTEQDTNQKEKPPARKPATLPNKNPIPVIVKRQSTVIKPAATTTRPIPRSPSPPASSASKTLLNIDTLDNIYVYQKNWIIMFDSQHNYNCAAKIGPAIDPVSIHANTIGHVYVMSEKGELIVYN